MPSFIRVGLLPALAAGSLAFVLSACGAAPSVPTPARPTAAAAADSLGDHYAALEVLADSVVAAQSPDDGAPSELAQATARHLAGRIEALSGDYGTLSVAMTAAEYERGVSLWMRLALAQAALELIHEDAYRLANDPTTGPADLRDLADRLSGALELGRVSGRMASRAVGASERRWRPIPPTAGCRSCRTLDTPY
jgi:hypothetical protein